MIDIIFRTGSWRPFSQEIEKEISWHFPVDPPALLFNVIFMATTYLGRIVPQGQVPYRWDKNNGMFPVSYDSCGYTTPVNTRSRLKKEHKTL